MVDPHSPVKFANNEPMRPFFKDSQINIFAEDHRGDGVQHAALTVGDIIATVRGMRGSGVEFMPTPGTYYDMMPERLKEIGVGSIDENIDILRELEILVDGEAERKYLLQIFLKESAAILDDTNAGPFFFEIIQRKGSNGFGAGNFRALFESIERQQRQERAGCTRACPDAGASRRRHGRQEAPRRAARRRRAALRGVPDARRLRRAVHDPVSPRAAARAEAGRRGARLGGAATPADAARGRCASATIGRRSSRATKRAARRCARAAALQSRRHPRRRQAGAPTIRPTSPTATATTSTTCTRAAARCARVLGDVRLRRRRLRVRAARPRAPLRARRRARSTGCRSRPPAASGRSSSSATTSVSCAWTRRTRTATSRRPRSSGRATRASAPSWSSAAAPSTAFEWPSSPLDVVGWDGTVYPWAFPILNFQPRVVVGAPAADVARHLRGARRARVQLRAAAGRLRSGFRTVPVSARVGRLRRVPLLLPRQLHVAQGRGAGQRLAPSGGHPARAASGRVREAASAARRTDELAVMLDTYLPLSPTAAALGVEDPAYHDSFL